MDDHELLQAYAARKAEDAFQTLAERYMPLVYSAAMRQTGNRAAAEDVTQAVFLTLARKAGTISREVVLSGWLLRTTRYAAANARRLEERRQHYEREGMQAHVQMSETDGAWQRIAPMLDEAVDSLSGKDRDALVLRYFENMPLRSVADRLGVSEDGAQKRVSRAVEKLRRFFDRRGRVVAGSVLAGALSANAVQNAPSISVQGASQAAETLMQATLNTLGRMRLQILGIRAASVAVLVGLAVLPFLRPHPRTTVPPAVPVVKNTGQPVRFQRSIPTTTAAAAPQGKQLLLRVLDAQTAGPVSHARLILVSSTGNSRSTNVFSADANGTGVVVYSAEAIKGWNHRIEIFRDGYVPKFVSWSEYQQDRMEEIPAEYTVKVDPAVTIGGMVADEEGHTVAEARIVYTVSGPTQSTSRERLTMMGNYHTEVTDGNGRWSCSHVPARFGMISFRVAHPRYQEKTFTSDSPDAPSYTKPNTIAEADFLAGRALMRLQRGLVMAGIVADEHGTPIAGAKVTQNWYYRDPERYQMTDAIGSFRFENGRPTEISLTVQAAGYAPVVTSIVMKADADQLRFVLPAGKQLIGRVVDENGKGISGASIEAASPRADSTVLFEWRTKTDAEGRFAWDAAPEILTYAVSASGFEGLRQVKLSAGADEQIVRLTKKTSTASVRILGQLMDAETRQPLSPGSVQIWQTSKDYSSSTTRPETVGPDGKFRLKTSSGTLSYVLEAQADGYWPKRLTNQVRGDGEIWLDIALAKAPAIGGTIFTPAGGPAAGATLVICGRYQRAQMTRPGKFNVGPGASTTGALADESGSFHLPTKHDAEVVAVAHPEGFIEVPFAAMTSNTLLRLKPWGRIEGIAQVGGKGLANAQLHVAEGRNRSMHASISYRPTTDTDGRFVFETIPPGEWKVQRLINEADGTLRTGPRLLYFSHGVTTEVRSGQTANVILGGKGNTVTGKATAAFAIAPDVWTENAVALVQTEPPSEYRAMFKSDGSFRIEDVPAGEYTLKINLTEASDAAVGKRFKPFASVEKPVTIGPDTDTDLGVVELAPAN